MNLIKDERKNDPLINSTIKKASILYLASEFEMYMLNER
jgi:hypothetical protein